MNDLPDPTTQPNDPGQATSQGQSQIPTVSSIGGKEMELPRVASGEFPIKDATGQEFELPKEVMHAGVQAHPTTIPVPPKVQKLGVVPAGTNVPVTAPTGVVALPLTDDQIATGLHQGLTSSFRWLAEWCLRRLKQMHIGLKTIHGKFVRVRV